MITCEEYNDVNQLISYMDDNGNKVHLEYDDHNRVSRSYTDYDYIIYFYNENNQISYEEVYTNYGNLIRKVWLYYNGEYLDHVVSDDGIDVWLDKDMNKIS